MLSMIDSAVAGAAPFLPVRLVVFPEFAHAAPVYATPRGAAREAGRPDPERAHRPRAGEGEGARDLRPDRLDDRGRPEVAGRRLQRHVPDRADGDPLQVPQGQPVDPVRGPREPARPARLRRAALPGGRHPDRADRLRDLLRLALPRGDAPARGERRRGAGARLGLHGPLGRDGADGLVDGREPLPRAREHRLRRGREPGREPCATTRRTRGRAAAWWSTSTAASSPRPRRGRASGSSSARSTSPRCATSARRGAATTCSRTCAPRPTRSTARHVYPPAGAEGPLSYEENNARIDAAKKTLA